MSREPMRFFLRISLTSGRNRDIIFEQTEYGDVSKWAPSRHHFMRGIRHAHTTASIPNLISQLNTEMYRSGRNENDSKFSQT